MQSNTALTGLKTFQQESEYYICLRGDITLDDFEKQYNGPGWGNTRPKVLYPSKVTNYDICQIVLWDKISNFLNVCSANPEYLVKLCRNSSLSNACTMELFKNFEYK